MILRSGGILLGGMHGRLQFLRNYRQDHGLDADLSLGTRVEFLVDVIKRLKLLHVHVTGVRRFGTITDLRRSSLLCAVYSSRKKLSTNTCKETYCP